MKKIFLLLFSLIFSCATFAAPIKEIIFLGDSLTDNGNLYKLLQFIPKSPPYYDGRFTNGPTWAESVGNYFQEKYGVEYNIYAYGGATAILHGMGGFATFTLESELYEYYARASTEDKTKGLYVIWMGSNDYLFDDQVDTEALTTRVVNKISWAMTSLMASGATHFLIVNVPDLGRTPWATTNDTVDRLHSLSEMHNYKLAEVIRKFHENSPSTDIALLDIYNSFSDLLDHPAKYNQKYHAHISNTLQSCWEGGLFIRQHGANYKQAINTTLQTAIKGNKKTNYRDMSNMIVENPVLYQTYYIGLMQGEDETSCANPDQYVFWDSVHPTEAVHKMLALLAIDALAKYPNVTFAVKH